MAAANRAKALLETYQGSPAGIGAEIERYLGVSTDDAKSHQEFSGKYHLPFALLSDARGEVARRYGSLLRMGPLKFAKRHTFIIDPDGRIARIYRKVRPREHSDRVIADLEQLRAAQTQQGSRS